MELLRGKFTTIIIVATTIVLAVIAIFTATRLYQLRTEPVAPTAPPESEASGRNIVVCQELAFTISAETTPTPTGEEPTPTPTDSPSATPTNSPTPTEPPVGGGPSPTPTTGEIAQITPTPTLAPVATTDELPEAGVEYPTIIVAGLGSLIIAFAFALAL